MREFPLSDREIEMLDVLASRYHTSYGQVLEFLIADRYHASDCDNNKIRKRDAWRAYRTSHMNIGVETAWHAGYSTGWIHFQTRHNSDNPYILKEFCEEAIREGEDRTQSDEDRIALLEREVAALKEILAIAQAIWSHNEKL